MESRDGGGEEGGGGEGGGGGWVFAVSSTSTDVRSACSGALWVEQPSVLGLCPCWSAGAAGARQAGVGSQAGRRVAPTDARLVGARSLARLAPFLLERARSNRLTFRLTDRVARLRKAFDRLLQRTDQGRGDVPACAQRAAAPRGDDEQRRARPTARHPMRPTDRRATKEGRRGWTAAGRRSEEASIGDARRRCARGCVQLSCWAPRDLTRRRGSWADISAAMKSADSNDPCF